MSQKMHLRNTLYTTREAMCLKANIEARSRNHCGRRKAISVTYSVCVSAA
jgi:hypothetical protein